MAKPQVGSLAAILVALAAACGTPPSQAPVDSGAPEAPSAPCPEGFARPPAQPMVCREIVPSEACAPGTAPFIGSAACQPVGWTAPCPAGFQRDPSGWGCTDVTPEQACPGATRERLASKTCAPIGDCSAPFPPKSALLVDDDFTAAQLDATHFRTIGAAVAAAPEGAVVAVAAGRYVESVTIPRRMTLVGQCAAQVTLAAPLTAASQGAGLRVAGVTGVAVRGLALRGFLTGVSVTANAEVALEGVWVDQPVGAGLYVEESRLSARDTKVSGAALRPDGSWGWAVAAGLGSTVALYDSTLTGGVNAVYAASDGTEVTVTQAVIARQAPSGARRSSGLLALGGATIRLRQSVVRDVEGDGAAVADEGGFLEVEESVLRGTRVKGSLARGHGVVALMGGQVTVRASAIVDNESVSLSAQGFGSRLEVTDSVVRGPAQSHALVTAIMEVSSDRSGIGMQVVDAAAARLDGVAVIGAWGVAVAVQSAGVLEAHRVFVDETRGMVTTTTKSFTFAFGIGVGDRAAVTVSDSTIAHGALAGLSARWGGVVRATGVLVREVRDATLIGLGAGVLVSDDGLAELSRCAFDGNTGSTLLVLGGSEARLRVADSAVHGTRVAAVGFGHGVEVGPQAALAMDNTFVFDNFAVGVVVAGGRATVTHSVFSRNLIALHVQDGTLIVESADTGSAKAEELRISPDTQFTDNGAKLGAGVLPLTASLF